MKRTRDLERSCPLNGQRIPNGFRADSQRIPNGFLTDSERIPNGFRADSERIPNGFPTDSEANPHVAEGHRGWSKNDYGMGVVTHAARVTTHTIRLGAVLLAGSGDHPTRHEAARLRAV